MIDDAQFLEELRAAFGMETEERLRSMSENLYALEKLGSSSEQKPLIETIYRDAHSLKGAARAVDFYQIQTVCQALESLLAKAKNGQHVFHPAFFDLVYDGIDYIEKTMRDEESNPDRYMDLSTALESFSLKEDAGQESADISAPPAEPMADDDVSPAGSKTFDTSSESSFPVPTVPSRTQEDAGSPHVSGLPGDRETVDAPVKSAGSVRVATDTLDRLLLQAEELVSLKTIASEDCIDLQALVKTMEPALRQLREVDQDMRYLRKHIQAEEQAGHDHEYAKRMGRVLGYVTTNESLYRQLQRRIREMIRMQTSNLHQINRQVDEFLTDVKTLAMLPFSTLFAMFPRMVREISREQGKDVNLTLIGDDVEVDRRILEELKDVLVHLVRNALDHGLERPEERKRAGKKPVGALDVHVVSLEGKRLEVRVEDDGRGINLDHLRKKVVQEGAATTEELRHFSDENLCQLIFRSGISTSPIITEISGRGLGMAIVQEKIDFLGGTFSMSSVPGKGCSFRMKLPITLSTFKGCRIRVGDQVFLLPTPHMEQALRVHPEKIRVMEGFKTFVFRGKTLSLVDMGQILGVIRKKKSGYLNVVVVRAVDRLMGFEVDAFLGEHEVLVKSLGPVLHRVKNISGATIRRSGEVALILNVHDLIESGAQNASAGRMMAPAVVEDVEKTILVVEDSITSRMLLKNVLEGAGYRVLTAVDGRAGFTTLHTEPIDLVVSDIEMPRMDGFQMTKKIREDPTFLDLPIVLVTSLSSPKDRERGIDVGANAYILKSDFDQSDLLHTIKRLIL